MFTDTGVARHDPEWVDAVMRILPRMYRLGQVVGTEHYMLVYATVFFSAKEELRRGATCNDIRRQRSRILRYIDRAHRSDYDKELFAAPFARAVEDALSGRSPCVLQALPSLADAIHELKPGLSLDILELLDQSG
jgi:hypothetical protein